MEKQANRVIQKEDKIVIVGGAIIGLATALALTRKGFCNITIIDKAPTHEMTAPRVPINLGANAVRIFDTLGLKDQLLEQGYIWRHAKIMSPENDQIGYLDAHEMRDECGFPLATTSRPHMQNTLLSGLSSDVEIIRGVTIQTCKQDENGITIELSNGNTLNPDLLIGADGSGSMIREYIMGETEFLYDGNVSIQTLIPRNRLNDPNHIGLVESFTEVVSPLGSVGFGLNSESTANIFFNIPQDLVPNKKDTDSIIKMLRERFGKFADPIPGLLDALRGEDLVFYYPGDKTFETNWSKGHVVIVGDAAHPCFQYTGQGSAMGMEGAMILASSLAQSMEKQEPITTALANYAEWHAPRVEVVHSESRKMGKIFGMTGTIPVWLRNNVMPLIPEKFTSGNIVKIHTKKAKYD